MADTPDRTKWPNNITKYAEFQALVSSMNQSLVQLKILQGTGWTTESIMEALFKIDTLAGVGNTHTVKEAYDLAAGIVYSQYGQGASVYKNTVLFNNTSVYLNFDTVKFDNDGIFELANSDRLTCKTAGIYLINAYGEFASVVGGLRQMFVTKNETDTQIGKLNAPIVVGQNTYGFISIIVPLEIDDYIRGMMFQDSGEAINGALTLSMVRIG